MTCIKRIAWLGAAMFLLQTARQGLAAEPLPVYPEHQNLMYYLDAANTQQPVKTVADWEIRRKHVLAHMQTVMGPLPKPENPVSLDVKTVEEKRLKDGLRRRKITYHTDSPEQSVSAYLFLPQTRGGRGKAQRAPGSEPTGASLRSSPGHPAILCLHQTTRIGKEEPAGLGGKPNLHYALELAQRGYVTLAPDYPSFGEYEYDFQLSLPLDGGGQGGGDTKRPRYISGTMKAVYDNIRAVDLLQSLPGVDPERIGCIGHSLGGHNTMFTAAFEPRIKVMVSNCGFTRFHKYYEGNLKGWTSQRYMPLIAKKYNSDPDKVPFDFTEIVASFAPRPFLAVAPVRDHNFEISGVKDVIAAARPVYELYGKPDNLQAIYPDCGHDFPLEARQTAYKFLDRHLKSDGANTKIPRP